jgi:hypothetical protein
MNGAPFPLRTWADTQQDFGTPVWRKMQVQIENGTMPLTSMSLTPPVEDLTAEERQTLLEWFDAGAPPGASACP